MNCLIVDDDNISRSEAEQLVKKISSLNLVASCSNALEAFNAIKTKKIELIFLDVMMPGMSGLELIKSLSNDRPQVILMTSEKNYAVEAFNYDVTDFLVKPLSEERFLRAVSKVKNNHQGNGQGKVEANTDFIFVKVDSVLVKINTADILYIEAVGDYVSIHTTSSRYVVHSTMKSILDKLSLQHFLRVHNSFIVRLDKISSIEDNSIIINKNLIPLSRLRKNELMERLNLL